MANPEPAREEGMSDDEYRAHFGLLTGAVKLIASLPLDRLARTIERLESLAPLLDPTGWMKQGHNIEDARDLVRGAQALMREVENIRQRAKKRGAIR